MILKAKNITEEPSTVTISYKTVEKKYIAASTEITITLPDDIIEVSAFSDFPDSVIITGVL